MKHVGKPYAFCMFCKRLSPIDSGEPEWVCLSCGSAVESVSNRIVYLTPKEAAVRGLKVVNRTEDDGMAGAA